MKTDMKIIDDFIYSVINKRSGAEKTVDNDLLTLYMNIREVRSLRRLVLTLADITVVLWLSRDDKGAPLSAEAVRDAILNLIIAG